MNHVISSIVIMAFLAISSIAQENLLVDISINGKVTDKDSKKAVSGATVQLEKAKLTATTDNEGNFSLEHTAPVGISGDPVVLPNGFQASIQDGFLSIHLPGQSDVIITTYSLQGEVLSKIVENFSGGSHRIASGLIHTGVDLVKVEWENSEIILKGLSKVNGTQQNDGSAPQVKALKKQANVATAFTDKLLVTKSGYEDVSLNIDNPKIKGISIEMKIKSSGKDADPKALIKSGNPGNAKLEKYADEQVGNPTIGLKGTGKARTITGPIVVPRGVVYDGKGEKLTAKGMGDGSQDEGQQPFFILLPGAGVKNVTLTAPGCEGIHMMGDNTLENIVWEDVGEDAASIRSFFPGGKIRITGGSVNSASDKVFQLNSPGKIIIKNLRATNISKLVRQGGNTPIEVVLDGVKASNVKTALVMCNNSKCTLMMRNTSGRPVTKGPVRVIDWKNGASD